jgi:RHS repeat-associated protein
MGGTLRAITDGHRWLNSAKSRTLVLVLGLVLLFALSGGIGIASGQEEESVDAGPAAASPAGVELPGHRTATSNTFELPDGSLEARIYETPVNYRDEDGDWQPIDQELRETATGSLTNGDNSFDVHLPEDLGEAPVKVAVGEQWVSEKPLGIQTEPAELQDGSVATYAAEGDAADFEFSGLANGLKETIELSDSSAPSTYYFRLEASAGIAPILAEDGSIEFRDEAEDLVAEMPAPVMIDSADAVAPAGAIHYNLEEDGAHGWKLAVEADPQWLQASERSWPVVIDPSVTVPAPAQDCVIMSFSEATACGTVGYNPLSAVAHYQASGQTNLARSLLRFNLTPTIPTDAYLTSATIGLYSAKTATNVTKVDLYDVSRSWDGNVSWKYWGGKRKSSEEWASKGGEFGKYMPTPTSLTPAQRGGSGPGWWNFSSPDLTWLAQRWLDGVIPNNGVLLKFADESPYVCCLERRVEWESSAGATEKKPNLSVQYLEPADAEVTSPSDGTTTAKRFLLTSAWDESGVEGVTFQYKIDGDPNVAVPWTDITASQVIDGKNQNVTWPYPVTKPEDRESRPLYWDASSLTGANWKQDVQIRAVLTGSPGAGGYTKPVAVKIDKDAGGPKDAVESIGPGSVDLLTGNFTVSRTDVSIPAFGASLEFSRSLSSRGGEAEATGVLGPGWEPASPVEEAGGSAWSKLKLESMTEDFEGEAITFKWATLTHSEGGELAFEEDEEGKFITPDEMSGFVLYRLNGSEIAFTDPDGNRTVFSNGGSGNEYLPISVAMTGGPGNKSRMIYELTGSSRRLKRVIAPAAPGITCSDEGATTTTGCRVLAFSYGQPDGTSFTRLLSITYYAPGQGGPWQVAKYSYDTQGRLVASWDPRVSPALKETYTYTEQGQIASLTPPGQSAWQMGYVADAGTMRGRLRSVSRATLVESNPTAQTTIAYDVPFSGSSAPFSMGGEAVGQWGQEDLPVDATAIFPPDEVPADPPSSYTRATVYYMDAEGQISNVATESGAGTSAPSITTTETDAFGNVARELSAQNRLRALAALDPVAKSRELDTQFRYSKDGTELQEEKGPMHQVRLGSGTTTQARLHRSIQYDAEFKYLNGTTTPSPGEGKPHLPTSETTGALLSSGSTVDKRSTEYRYDWTLRKPTETIADPQGTEETKSVTVYDKDTGLPTEMRQPSNAAGGGAGTTKFVYYKAGTGSNCESNAYAGLLCKSEPAAQPGGGQPQLLVKKFLSYNQLGEPLEVTESPGGGSENVRKTVTTYDAAGRQLTSQITGGGVAVPKVEMLYSGSLGLPTTQRFVCPESEPGCDTQATTANYDSLGRVTSYQDADGVTAETAYDFLGRPATVNDGKGTQTYKYDSVTGLLVELEDSAAGIFTASYDADGNQIKRGLPNGLTAEAIFDETGAPVALTYTKASNCGLSCNWLDFALERSINGQILLENGTLGKDEYGYDKLGRLVTARETPTGGSCTTRTYAYDKDSNRTSMSTIPGVGGACVSSGGTTQSYSYDSADRLLDDFISYDPFGRITWLPGKFAGGKKLTTTYFANDMVESQTQNGVTNTFQLDATLRQRQRLQAGGLEGTEVFHYAGPGDAPAWTERGSTWTRNISGIGGELATIQESGKEAELQLTNLHGDVVATAALSSSVTELKATFGADEFGNQTSGSSGRRFGWLGGPLRRTELASGVVQMGVRSYIPQLGRFLTPDPVRGGSANSYDYANQDPINQFDLTGECAGGYTKRGCARQQKDRLRVERAIRHANRNSHRVMPIVLHPGHNKGRRELEEGAEGIMKDWHKKAGWSWRRKKAEELEHSVEGDATSIPCHEIGLALSGGGVSVSSAGLATVWIPGVGETLLLVGSGIDMVGITADLLHEKGMC